MTKEQREALKALADVMEKYEINLWTDEPLSICIGFPPVFQSKYKTTTHADIKKLLQEQE